jgi:hypothetical protein
MFVQDAAGSESTHGNDRVAAWDVRHTIAVSGCVDDHGGRCEIN